MAGERSPSGNPLRVSERKRDELGPVAGLHPHQHGVLAGLVQVGQFLGDIGRIGDRLAADVEDDVAALHAVIGRRAVGVDRGDHGYGPGSAPAPTAAPLRAPRPSRCHCR
jgi:hypothetical protein